MRPAFGEDGKIHHGVTEITEMAGRPPCPSVMGRPEAASGYAGSHGRRRVRMLLRESAPGASRVPMLCGSVVHPLRSTET